MMLFLFLVVIALVFWLGNSSIRRGRMEKEIELLKAMIESIERAQASADERYRVLVRQVGELLRRQGPVAIESEPDPPRVKPEPAVVPAEPPPLPQVPVKIEPEPEPVLKPATDWEGLIGGNWANKAGVAVLVIGLALFLQYSLTHLGPAGRVGTGYLLGVVMLGAGLLLERRENWRTYARGLIGGGWAAIYFTSYAAHAIPAARVIDSAVVASLLLLGVALAMVLHSMRYRSQTVTGIAYFVTFGTLALTPLSAFAVVAAIPLAASLIYLGRRFGWFPMMALGQIAVYVLYLIHIGEIGLDPNRLVYGQFVLAIYWLIFEVSELSYVRPGDGGNAVLKARFALNAFALLAISLGQWGAVRPKTMWVPCFVLGALYLASTFVRATKVSPGTGTMENLALGGYEGAVTISAGLIAGGIYSVCKGLWVDAAWLLEAEVLFFCALYLGRPFLWQLAGVVFALPMSKLVFADIPDNPERATKAWIDWSPVALVAAVTFYVNRAVRRNQVAYSFAGTILVCTVVSFEAPGQWVAVLWLVIAAALFELGLRSEWPDMRAVSYAVGIPAAVSVLIRNLQVGSLVWQAQVAAAVLGMAFFARLVGLRGAKVAKGEANRVISVSAAIAAISLAGLANVLCPEWVLAPLWFAIALLLMEAGFRFAVRAVRAEAHVLVLLSLCSALLYDVLDSRVLWGLSHSVVAVSPVIAGLYYARYRAVRELGERWELRFARVYLYAAPLLSVLVVQTELDRVLVPIGWAAIGLILLGISVREDLLDLRRQAYLIGAAAFLRTLMVYADNGHKYFVSDALLAGCPVIAMLFASAFLLPRRPDSAVDGGLHAWARPGFAVLASVLLALLLFSEVRGSLLTVAWGAQGLLTLATGFPTRERALRFCGLAIFLLCVFKLFFYDLSALSTPYRIASFLVLGVLLLGASGLYTRFRETIRQYF